MEMRVVMSIAFTVDSDRVGVERMTSEVVALLTTKYGAVFDVDREESKEELPEQTHPSTRTPQ